MTIAICVCLRCCIIKSHNFSIAVSTEAVEIVTMQIDKYQSSKNWEAAARTIKEMMDKKFGQYWHCCIGEGFGFNMTYQQRNLLFMYYGEKLGILLYKC